MGRHTARRVIRLVEAPDSTRIARACFGAPQLCLTLLHHLVCLPGALDGHDVRWYVWGLTIPSLVVCIPNIGDVKCVISQLPYSCPLSETLSLT